MFEEHPTVTEVYDTNNSVTVISGSDSLNILNRSFSSSLNKLEIHRKIDALMCQHNGRIIGRFSICPMGNDVLLFGNNECSKILRDVLVKGTGWDEDVKISDADNAVSLVRVIGQDASKIISNIVEIPENFSNEKWFEDGDRLFSFRKIGDLYLFEIALPKNQSQDFCVKLVGLGCKLIDDDRWSFLRMSLGILGHADISGMLPLDIGLGSLVSLDKGCYPGQEIHARIDSRGEIKKKIVRIIGSEKINIGKQRIVDSGVAMVTSVCSVSNAVIAYAVVPNELSINEEIEIKDIGSYTISEIASL